MFPKNRRRAAKQSVDAAIHVALNDVSNCGETSDSLRLLMRYVRSRSSLLSTASEPLKWHDCRKILAALIEIARRRQDWLRPLHKWSGPQASCFVQFRSLVNHLFAKYRMPNFMAAVWLRGDPEAARWLELFIHLGRGRSIRQFETPIRLTKSMARFFMLAPDDLTVEQALRWAQVRGLGGDPQLARTIIETVLAKPTTDESFWESVIRFLIVNAPPTHEEVRQIVGFIHQQRFEPAEKVWGRGAGDEPLQPNFEIQGRSLRSLRRHMSNWREELLPKMQELPSRSEPVWPATGIGSFQHDDGSRRWTIEELLTGKALVIEGEIMRHCVASYIHVCVRQRTSIWSMRACEEEHSKRVLTIQVSPTSRTILQAKGRKNAPPDDRSWAILQKWAEQEGLVLSSSVKR